MKRIIFILLTLIFSCIYTLQAQDSTSINRVDSLSEVSIYGSQIKTVVSQVSTIKIDAIPYFAQETPQIFTMTPSVVNNTDNGSPFGYSYLRLRGMDQSRINYTLNGVPLNDGEDMSVYTSNYTDILSLTSRTDLYRGAGYSENGVSSFAGLVSMETKKAGEDNNEIGFMFGSFNSYRMKMNLSQKALQDKFGYTIGLSTTGTEGYRDNSFGRSGTFNGALSYNFGKLRLSYYGILSLTSNGMSWLPTPEELDGRVNLLTPNEKDHFRSQIHQLNFTYKFNDKSKIVFSPYFLSIVGEYNFSLGGDQYGYLNLNGRNIGAFFNYTYANSNLKVSTGLTSNFNSRRHNTSFDPDKDIVAYTDRGNKYDGSAFFKAAYDIGHITVETDLQLRHVNFGYNNVSLDTSFYNYTFFNPRVGLAYKIGSGALFASGAISNREPTRTDLFQSNDYIDYNNIDQVASVKPEKVYDGEFGYRYASKKLSFSLNGYVMQFHNEIMSTNQANYLGIMLRRNVERSSKMGVEGEIKYKVNNWLSLYHNSTISKNKINLNDDSKEPMLTPWLIGFTSVKFQHNNISLELQEKHTSFSYLETSNNSNYVLPSYIVCNAILGFTMNDNVISIFVNNVMNKKYYSYGNVSYDQNNNIVGRNYFQQSGLACFVSLRHTF